MLAAADNVPSIIWTLPFVALLLCIAILPLIPRTVHWWEHNRNKLIVGLVLGVVTLGHYYTRGFGTNLHGPFLVRAFNWIGWPVETIDGHNRCGPGLPAVAGAAGSAAMEYLPFMILLFSLYTISGGIAVKGDIPAHPLTNTAILAVGGLLASFIGTTGASMLLIRPLLQTNSERQRIKHTVIFFIFIVSNIGGCLLPVGDPPLLLGYLRGVPFLWTLRLWNEWAFMVGVLLIIYYCWDSYEYRRERPAAIAKDETQIERIRVLGTINLVWLIGVVLGVALFDPANPVPGTSFTPPTFFREALLLALVALSWWTTPAGLRKAGGFNFTAIGEVACQIGRAHV